VKARTTQKFDEQYAEAPHDIQRAFDRKIVLLLQNLRHPSLRAKKYDEARDIWQARVTGAWRFYFSIEHDTYVLHSITPHPK
jgi:mRNA-degrading endonuclease RelE of RelBE toxin-antitoxin system